MQVPDLDSTKAVSQGASRVRAGLTVKLAIALVASTAAIFGVFGWLNLRTQRLESEQMVQGRGILSFQSIQRRAWQ